MPAHPIADVDQVRPGSLVHVVSLGALQHGQIGGLAGDFGQLDQQRVRRLAQVAQMARLARQTGYFRAQAVLFVTWGALEQSFALQGR
jgi:hypothetical protein